MPEEKGRIRVIPRVYLDSSVIGGMLDKEFQEYSSRLFQDFEAGMFKPVLSDITVGELSRGPERVRDFLSHPALSNAQEVIFGREAEVLANEYIKYAVVSVKSITDAQHIALATVSRVDLLLSWNFRHIVRLSRIKGFNAVNLLLGYPSIEIRSPMEVYYEEE